MSLPNIQDLQRCSSGEWYGYKAGSSVLQCDGSAACACIAADKAPPFRPPCSSTDSSCPHNGICVHAQESRCYYNLLQDHTRSLDANSSWSPFGFIDSTYCANVLNTNAFFSGPSNVVCWVAMEGVASPLTEAIVLDYPFPLNSLGLAVEQYFLYEIWNLKNFGSKCENFVDEVTQEFGGRKFKDLTPKEQCGVFEKSLDFCEDIGFKVSPRTDCSNLGPAPASPIPNPSRCASRDDFCTIGGEFGKCDSTLMCVVDRGRGQSCRVEGVLGMCSDGPGPEGACGACSPLDAPLCSSLHDASEAPHGCEEDPHWDDIGSARQACAPLRANMAWQCHLETPECPSGMQRCYWDGN